MGPAPFKFTIWRLMAIVALLALGLAGLRHAVNHWGAGEVTTLAWGVLLGTNVLAWFQKARWQVFWIGFGLSGWAYLMLSLGSSVGEHLPSTWLLDDLHARLYHAAARPTLEDDFNEGNSTFATVNQFRQAGQSVIGLLFGLLGGVGACILFPARDENRDEPPLPEGSLLRASWRDEKDRQS